MDLKSDKDLKTRVAKYNKDVAAFNDKKAHLGASAEIMKKQVLEGFKELTERLGVKVNKDNIKQLLQDEEDKIIAALEQGEQFLEGHKAALEVPVQAAPVSVQVKSPVKATPPLVKASPEVKETSTKVGAFVDDIMEGDSLEDLEGADDFLSDVGEMFEDEL